MNARASQLAVEALRGPRGAYASQASCEVLRTFGRAVASQAALEALRAVGHGIASQVAVEVLRRDYGGSMASQAAVEVLRTNAGTNVSQAALEVLRHSVIGVYASQAAIEALRSNSLGAHGSQISLEVMRVIRLGVHASQSAVEVLRLQSSPPRITQLALEILRTQPWELETVIPWPFPADAQHDITERYGYLSEVLRAQNGVEQRRLLRETAGGGISFTCTLLTALELQYAYGLLASMIGQKIGVPLWQYAIRLSAGCSAGDMTIPAETDEVPFYASAPAMLWVDPWTWEVVWIRVVEDGSLRLAHVLVGSWPAGQTILLPLVLGYLEEREAFGRDSILAGDLSLDFEIPAFFP